MVSKIQDRQSPYWLMLIWLEEPQTTQLVLNISPILWTKLPGSKSAGRVQSVALKLITEREHEIESFVPEEFWTLSVKFEDEKNQNITASISQLDNNKIEKFSFKE